VASCDYPGAEATRLETETQPVVGHVQADAFCEGCGYNLHTQAVTRDERLGILICRCPECGRFSAAGNLTAARQVWLNRLGLGLLIAWIGFLVVVFGLLTLFHGVMANGNTQEAVTFEPLPQTKPGVWAGYHYVLRTPPASDSEAYHRRVEQIIITVVCALLGAVAGGAVSVCMWHVRDWRRVVAFVPALVGVGLAFSFWINDPTMADVREVAYGRMGFVLLVECAGVLIGLLFGRAVARGALSILIPPVPRQHLSFLWTADGKTLRL
jgi:hypothetical protein